MKIGRVVGTVVSTINAPAFDGRTLLLCDLLDPAGTPAGGGLGVYGRVAGHCNCMARRFEGLTHRDDAITRGGIDCFGRLFVKRACPACGA